MIIHLIIWGLGLLFFFCWVRFFFDFRSKIIFFFWYRQIFLPRFLLINNMVPIRARFFFVHMGARLFIFVLWRARLWNPPLSPKLWNGWPLTVHWLILIGKLSFILYVIINCKCTLILHKYNNYNNLFSAGWIYIPLFSKLCLLYLIIGWYVKW